MIGKRQVGAVLLVLVLAVPACAAESAEDAVEGVFQGLSQGKVEVVWDALPASYQNDVSFLVHTMGEKMPPEIWNEAFAVGKKLVKILETKKEWLLANPQLAAAGDNVKKLEDGYDPFVGILALLVNSELSDLKKVKALDLRRFAAGTMSKILQKGVALQEATGQEGPRLSELNDVTVTQVDVEQGVATLSVAMADQPVQTTQFVQVQGKWIPQDMAAMWSIKMTEAKAKVEAMDMKANPAATQQVMGMLQMVGTQLDVLANAETEEQFNASLDGIQQMVMMVVMMQMQQQQGQRGGFPGGPN
jgi:hypothetical protein